MDFDPAGVAVCRRAAVGEIGVFDDWIGKELVGDAADL